jgi:rfaE bifunctional protein kinase chain/domain
LDTVSAVVIEDYDKGVLSPAMVEYIVRNSVERNLYLAVDPKIRNFWNYAGCSLFKPNRHEAGYALGTTIDDTDKAVDAAGEIRSRLSAEAVLITLGSSGSVLVQGNGRAPLHLPAVTRNVFDVSGAGDSVIAVMGLAGSCRIETADAATLANLAAAAVCREPGVYAVSPEDIAREADRFE